MPTRIMNTGTSGSVSSMITAEVASTGTIHAITAIGTTHASTSWGRKRPK